MGLFKNTHRRAFGEQAEKAAAAYLKRQGLHLHRFNYHCRFGEIDIIMRDQETWVFVEVRCRAENAPVSATESISSQKMRKIRKTADYFTMRFKEMPDCRFDVISMTHSQDKIGYTVEWIQNAF